VIVRFSRTVLGAFACAALCTSPAGAERAVVPALGPLQAGALAAYDVAWTTLVDGQKTLSVSSILAMRERAGEKIVASFRDSQDSASIYVMTRAADGTLALDNSAHLDRTGALLGQAVATLDQFVGVLADEAPAAQTWTKSVAVAVPVADPAAPQQTTLIALTASRSVRADGFTVTATGTSTQDVAATPAPAAMRLLSRVMRQKPGQTTTTCTLEGRYTGSGVLTWASLETKTTTTTGKQTSTVDTSWHIMRTT
jgi:hypothetical protein